MRWISVGWRKVGRHLICRRICPNSWVGPETTLLRTCCDNSGSGGRRWCDSSNSCARVAGQLENTETRERKRERKRKQPKDLENVASLMAILSPRVSDEPELAPHWVHPSIRKLIPGRHNLLVIVKPRVVVYRLTSSQP